jgi:hypothetical protein
MLRIDTYFLLLAVASLIFGSCLGIYMGINEDFQLAPVHAHLNLVGWASLALFGVIYRLYPELIRSRFTRFHVWLAMPSAPLLPAGLYLAQFHQSPLLAIVASLLWLAGVLVFFVIVAELAFSRSSSAKEAGE